MVGMFEHRQFHVDVNLLHAFNAPVGVIPFDDLRDFWWVSNCGWPGYATVQNKIENIPEKLNPLSRVHARHKRHANAISQT